MEKARGTGNWGGGGRMMSQTGESSIVICAILLLKLLSLSLTTRFVHISQSLPWAHAGMAGVGAGVVCCEG